MVTDDGCVVATGRAATLKNFEGIAHAFHICDTGYEEGNDACGVDAKVWA